MSAHVPFAELPPSFISQRFPLSLLVVEWKSLLTTVSSIATASGGLSAGDFVFFADYYRAASSK